VENDFFFSVLFDEYNFLTYKSQFPFIPGSD